MIFWLTASAKGESIQLCRNWNVFCLLWYNLGCAWLWLAEEFLQKWWMLFLVVATRLSCKTMCTITTKQHNSWFLVLRRIFQNVTVGFTLLTVVETRRFYFWLKCKHTYDFYILDNTHLQYLLLLGCPPTNLSFYIWLVKTGRRKRIICWVTSSSFFFQRWKNLLCLFLLSLRALLIWRILWTNNQAPHFPQPKTDIGAVTWPSRDTQFSVETIFSRTIDISINILNWFWALFKNVNPLNKRQQKRNCFVFKRNIAHLAHRATLRTLIIASAKRLKSLFVQAKFTQTLCFPTTHAPKKVVDSNKIPQIRGECVKNRNCSQFFHTCFQRNIGSCRDGKFCEG